MKQITKRTDWFFTILRPGCAIMHHPFSRGLSLSNNSKANDSGMPDTQLPRQESGNCLDSIRPHGLVFSTSPPFVLELADFHSSPPNTNSFQLFGEGISTLRWTEINFVS